MPACTSNWNCRATPPSRVKIAVPIGRSLAAVGDYVGTLLARAVDVGRRLVAMLPRDQRAHLHVGLETVADLDLRETILDRLHQTVRRIPDRNDLGDRHAALSRRAIGR